jgi:hypothetical protein
MARTLLRERSTMSKHNRERNMMNVLKWAVVLLMAGLGLMAGAPAPASPTPDNQADVTYLHLLDQNGVSSRNPEAMVSYAHDLVDQLSASPQNDASVGFDSQQRRGAKFSARHGRDHRRRSGRLQTVPDPGGSALGRQRRWLALWFRS